MSERINTRMPVVLRLASGDVDATTRNVSIRGMFILTSVVVPVGSTFSVRLRLPEMEADVETEVTVRWTQAEGIGVAFGSLRALDVWALHQLLKDEP